MKSPISNQSLMAMLCYLWDCSPSGRVYQRQMDHDGLDVVNLAAHILSKSVSEMILFGLEGSYLRVKERTRSLRGRMDPRASARRWHQGDAACVCSFDRWSIDTPAHRYLSHHLRRFSMLPQIARTTRERFKRQNEHFSGVNAELPGDINHENLPRSCNFRRYKLAISVCKFLAEMARWTEDIHHSPWTVTSARRSLQNQLHYVFEKFVRKFYAVELLGLDISSQYPSQDARARVLTWPATYASSASRKILLPKMITDSTIFFSDRTRILVVETKLKKPLLKNPWKKINEEAARKELEDVAGVSDSEAGCLRPADLYQLVSYLHATQASELPKRPQVDGLLLYPEYREAVDVKVDVYGFRLRVATVNLRAPWAEIRERLGDIARPFS